MSDFTPTTPVITPATVAAATTPATPATPATPKAKATRGSLVGKDGKLLANASASYTNPATKYTNARKQVAGEMPYTHGVLVLETGNHPRKSKGVIWSFHTTAAGAQAAATRHASQKARVRNAKVVPLVLAKR